MFKKRCVKIGLILVVLVALIAVNTSTFGAINESYYNDIVQDLNVIDGALDSKVKGSVLLDAIAVLVYAVGSLMEWILGGIFQGISGGEKVFPWADAVLFNAIPLLDVNVFNPSGASLVGIMQEFIADSYWTIFYLAQSFLGIAIMVTAIKLAVSTIASDKAQYKQAIVKWIMGFIMLWGIHFFISFVLYLNEGLVEYASAIAKEATKDSSIDLAKLRDTTQTDQEIVYNFVAAMNSGQANALQIIGTVAAVVAGAVVIFFTWPAWVTVAGGASVATVLSAVGSTTVALAFTGVSATAYMGGIQLTRDEFVSLQGEMINSIRNSAYNLFDNLDGNNDGQTGGVGMEQTLKFLSYDNTVMVAARLLKNDNYVDSLQAISKTELLGDSQALTWKSQANKQAVYYLAADTYLIIKNQYDVGNGAEDFQILLENYLNSINSIPSQERVSRLIKRDGTGKYDFSGTQLQGNLNNTSPQDKDVNYDEMVDLYCQGMIYAREDYLSRQSGSGAVFDKTNIISTLAKAFKEMAWTNTATSWKPSKPVIQGALLYAILVAQSLIFFISYAKRLFYVIILILMAPVIVVYDFFTKFSS